MPTRTTRYTLAPAVVVALAIASAVYLAAGQPAVEAQHLLAFLQVLA